MNVFGKVGALIAAVGLLIAGSGCGQSEGGEVDGIQIVQEGKLTVCTHLPYKPFQFEQDGEVVGFEKDILDLLAKDMGLQQEVVNMGAWEQVTSGKAFDNGICDVGMGAMTITPERQKALTITKGYFDATQVLVVKSGSGLDSLEAVEPDRIGVQADTTGEAYVQDQGIEPRRFDDLSLQLSALSAGEIDAAVNDNGPVYDWLNDNPDYEVSAVFDTDEQYGFPAKGDDPNAEKLIKRLEGVIAKAKQDGTYDKLYKKWFGVEPGEKPAS